MINLEQARQEALKKASDISELLRAHVEEDATPRKRDPRRDDD